MGRRAFQSHYQTWASSPIDQTDSAAAAGSSASATDSVESGAVAEIHSAPPLVAMLEPGVGPSDCPVAVVAAAAAAVGGNFGLGGSVGMISRAPGGTRPW